MDFGDLKGASSLADIRLQEGRIKSTESTSSGVGVRIRSADDSTDADIIARRVVGQSLAIGEVDIYIRPGNLAPTNPSLGDLWFEVGSQSEQLYGWPWCWSGSYWLSPVQERVGSFQDINSSRSREFDLDPDLDYFFTHIQANGTVATNNTSPNVWGFQVERIDTANAVAQILQTSSTGWPINATRNVKSSGAVHVDVSAVSAQQLRFTAQKNATAGNFNGSIAVKFRYARP